MNRNELLSLLYDVFLIRTETPPTHRHRNVNPLRASSEQLRDTFSLTADQSASVITLSLFYIMLPPQTSQLYCLYLIHFISLPLCVLPADLRSDFTFLCCSDMRPLTDLSHKLHVSPSSETQSLHWTNPVPWRNHVIHSKLTHSHRS